MKKFNLSLIGMSFALVLSACGGGEGEDGVSEEPDDTLTFAPAPITFSNANDIVSSVNYSGQKSLENFAVSTYFDLAIGEGVQECESGSRIIDKQISDSGNVLSRDDRITLTYDNCVYGDTTTDGTFTLLVESSVGDLTTLENFEFSVSVEFSELTIASQDSFERIDGDISTSISFNDSFGFSVESSSTMLTIEENENSFVLENFISSYQSNIISGANSYTISGTVHSSELEGSVSFETVEAFSGGRRSGPEAGMLIITGADNSSITLEVLGVNNVVVEIDSDGDGVADSSTQGEWVSIVLSFFSSLGF